MRFPSGLDLPPEPPHLRLCVCSCMCACQWVHLYGGIGRSPPNEYPESCWHSVEPKGADGIFFFYSTLLKLRPAESFSLGLSSCSWASRISTSCSIRRTEELTSPANTGPCVWRASSLAKLAAFSPLRIWKQQQGKGVSETRKQGGLEMAPQREAEMMRTKYTIQLWSTVTGLAQNERKVVYRTQVNRDWMFSREHNGMTARDMP